MAQRRIHEAGWRGRRIAPKESIRVHWASKEGGLPRAYFEEYECKENKSIAVFLYGTDVEYWSGNARIPVIQW